MSKLVLVTGVNGFIAGHVAEALLENGYRVRGTARSTAARLFQDISIPKFEVVAVDDITTGDFTNVLKGVYAVIHVASPLPGKMSTEAILKDTVDGALNVVRQAEKAGVKKFVVTSSFSALFDASLYPAFGGLTFNEDNWSPTTVEDITAKASDNFFTYFGLKAIAERKVWEFARQHWDVDVATIIPGFVYGPWAKSFPGPAKNGPLGTNGFFKSLLNGSTPPGAPPFVADVRDVALAHVRALALPPTPSSLIEEKRFIVNGGNFPWRDVAAYIKKVRPGLNGVTDPEKVADIPGPVSTLDTTRARKVLGFDALISPQKTVEDTVDAIVELQEKWESVDSIPSKRKSSRSRRISRVLGNVKAFFSRQA